MRLLDKVKENIQGTATMAREGVEDIQTKHELGQAYGELGRRTFELIEAGMLDAAALTVHVELIRKLNGELADEPSEGNGSQG